MRYSLTILVAFILASSSVISTARDTAPADAVKPAPDENEALGRKSVLESLKLDGRFKILLSTLKDTELERTLAGGRFFTFFAPMDEAFERVPKLAELLENKEKLLHVLNRHLIPGRTLDTEALWKEIVLQPKEGKELKVKYSEKSIGINDAKILLRDLRGKEGIAHGIDHVLMDENDSFMRSAGGTIERGLKKGTRKIKETFKGKGDNEVNPESKEVQPEKNG